jgi:transcriptional regulator with XRE-family HTH domain
MTTPLSADPVVDSRGVPSDRTIGRAIGEELRRRREARGWSREQLCKRLPSGIGDRTLLSYELATRQLTAIRLIEICRVLEVDPGVLVSRALQRARIHVDTIVLHINLRYLLTDIETSSKWRPMTQWARNALNACSNGVIAVEPVAVQNLAWFVGCNRYDLANYLARFPPED